MLKELFLSFRGWRIWCGIAGELDGRTPLVCVPGGPGMSHDYIITMAQLRDRHPVIFYDPIGSGVSEKPADVSFTLELYAEELMTVCRAFGPGPVHVWSHSMASLIVLEALRRPLPFVKSVTLGSPVVNVPIYAREVRRRVEELTDDFAAFMKAEAEPALRATPEFARIMNQFMFRNLIRRVPLPDCLTRGFKLVNRAAHAQMKKGLLFYLTPMAELDMTPQLAGLTVPTLLTCGEHDPSSPDDCKSFAAQARDCDVAVLPGCSHMPHLENSVAYAAVVRRFLDGVEARAAK